MDPITQNLILLTKGAKFHKTDGELKSVRK